MNVLKSSRASFLVSTVAIGEASAFAPASICCRMFSTASRNAVRPEKLASLSTSGSPNFGIFPLLNLSDMPFAARRRTDRGTAASCLRSVSTCVWFCLAASSDRSLLGFSSSWCSSAASRSCSLTGSSGRLSKNSAFAVMSDVGGDLRHAARLGIEKFVADV